ncbi:MAG TPA: ABC transporter ATP-binding protein [Solirubrobacteraceae bacterium]
MAEVRFEQATRIFRGAATPAVDGLELELADGELLVLVGPSGSGKSTALRMLAGLEEVDAGAVYIGDRDVTDLPPKHRDIAMVFQNYALYPYLDVRANIGFPLKVAGVSKAERERRVTEAAEMLGLTPLLGRKPAQLSGGERQRTAMGRAIVRNPQVFLMDEPLSNLDAKLRVKMRVDIAALQRRLGVTMLYVTHDQVEAMTMGERVAVLRDGRLQQCGPPRELYNRPANVFVAGFIGTPAMNLCPARLNGDGVAELCGTEVELSRETASAAQALGLREVVVGLRPESLEINGAEGIQAEVEVVEELGADAYAFCVAELAGSETKLIARTDWRQPPQRGERVALLPRAGEAHAFDPETGERLGG